MTTNQIALYKIIVSITVLVLYTSCGKELSRESNGATQTTTLHFKPVVGDKDLEFGKSYTNASGEAFAVRTFKFYVSGIDLISDSLNTTYEVDRSNYFLVDFSDSSSATLILKTKPDIYNRIAFVIGVDSLHNVSGAQTGALDPVNGMFWTWNSGYIMAKLEGNSPVSLQPDNIFEYHIGGFKGSDNVVQQIVLAAPIGKEINTTQNKTSEVTVTADVSKWFNGATNISIARVPVCTTPGPLAKRIADNYSHMFTIEDIVNQ